MKKALLIIGLLVLSIFVFTQMPEYTITTKATEISLQMRLYEVNFDLNGHMKDFSILQNRSNTIFLNIYKYYNDSFDILDENGNEILPESYKITEGKDKEYVEITFLFKNGGEKSYKFYNSPYYDFDVSFKNINGKVIIPTISYPNTVAVDNELLISYLAKPIKSIFIFDSKDIPIENNSIMISGSKTFKAYMGPRKYVFIKQVFPEKYDRIKELSKQVGAINWLWYINYGFVTFLWWLYKFTGNFGWAIMIFTFVIRLLLYPLYHRQTKSMIEMRRLQPEVEKIKKKYKDPQRQQQALMELYKEHKINPADGCLTAFIQLPIFWILYGAINYYQGTFAYNPQFLIWSDLSQGGFKQNILLVLISVAAYFFNALQSATDRKTAWNTAFMMIIFPFLFIGLPTGIFIYWVTNAILQVFITYYVNKKNNIKGLTVREFFGLGPKPYKAK
ncbi:membrane protein insertase, YidC/Oxa1 family, C-terminal domain protein [Marinitoga piezophila KA3]|uniref:Membrane protein insertase YidC n=1 Tax=Marinitoga piezophila (strain DSM 14283 / JCM 11233 / KA3) TaxID=443254 RepID=H2J6W9_MARPK|nr:membrane protein insertase YidC [Marinitoga piezophila]AEX85234.1 membrane protein insertase, YidC/Oxa1 family, C-terminal domain protein [Marinitoga piezophila KA3]